METWLQSQSDLPKYNTFRMCLKRLLSILILFQALYYRYKCLNSKIMCCVLHLQKLLDPPYPNSRTQSPSKSFVIFGKQLQLFSTMIAVLYLLSNLTQNMLLANLCGF